MDFSEAIKLLKEGKQLKRKYWTDAVFLEDGVFRYTLSNNYLIPVEGDEYEYYHLQDEDILANDWEEVK